MKIASVLLVLLGLLLGARASAQNCHPPGSFYRTSTIRGSLVMQPGVGTDCDLVATLDPTIDAAAGAFAWYRLSTPVTVQWRISFRLDLSQQPPLTLFSGFGLFDANSATAYPPVNGNVALVRAAILADESTFDKPFALVLVFACNGSIFPCAAKSDGALADGDLVRVELNMGAGAGGFVRWWINGEFTDPPTGEADDLDNVAWGGVSSVALGAFSPQGGSILTGGVRIRISDIEVADDAMFAAGFDY